MLIDQDSIERFLTARALKNSGYSHRTFVASSSEEALLVLKDWYEMTRLQPDILLINEKLLHSLSDLMGSLAEVMGNKAFHCLTVILMSATSLLPHVGAEQTMVVEKPLTKESIEKIVQRYFSTNLK